MDPKLTTLLAGYGALVSTVGIFWQIFIWRRNNPRLVVTAEAHEGRNDLSDGGIVFEIRNMGGKATTIEEVMFVTYENWLARILKRPNRVEYLSRYHANTIKLPVSIQAGDLWRGDCPVTPTNHMGFDGNSRLRRFEQGKLFFRVKCAHTDRLISGVVKPKECMPRL